MVWPTGARYLAAAEERQDNASFTDWKCPKSECGQNPVYKIKLLLDYFLTGSGLLHTVASAE